MATKKNMSNPWTAEDEREHPGSSMEWWAIEAFFTSDDGNQWSIKTALNEWCNKSNRVGSNFVFTLFNMNTKEHFAYDQRNDTVKLESKQHEFHIKFNDSYIKGSYPKYKMHFHDPKNKIELDMTFNATALPRWVAQEATNGWLPLGLGFYRYGFIPKCTITGTLKINGKHQKIKGDGYFEHVWGNFTYHKTGLESSGLAKTLTTYAQLISWWKQHNNIRIPQTISFSTDNNPLGYDWAWALLDNGWTLFYGNILMWVMEGPVAGSLILSKDGNTYEEFCNVRFRYTETRPGRTFDFVYPTAFELTATSGKEKLYLRFNATVKTREYTITFPDRRYWQGLVICEEPGRVEGFYDNGTTKTKLNGICKMEPQRQVSRLGHNSLKIKFIKPPKGVGVSFFFISHFFKKDIAIRMQLAPFPKITLKVARP